MEPITRSEIERLFQTFEKKDLEAVLAAFADDAILCDPHYPIPEMRGRAAIRRGLEWAFGSMEQPGFVVRNCWIEGGRAALEVDTHHRFKGGMELRFPQVFVVEFRAGLVTRLQSYVPYPAPGIAGWMATMTRWAWKLQGKR